MVISKEGGSATKGIKLWVIFFLKTYHEVSEAPIYIPWIKTTESVWKHQWNRYLQD